MVSEAILRVMLHRAPLALAGALLTAWLLVSPTAKAQPTRTPAPSGLYESWSPVNMTPVGSLASPPTILPRWLSVVTVGSTSTISFQPDGRIVWKLTYGPFGLTEKVAEVDGEVWTRSAFTYDAAGLLATKTVSGTGVSLGPHGPSNVTYTYRTDPQGRVIERTGTLVSRRPTVSRNLPVDLRQSAWTVSRTPQQTSATLRVGGQTKRIDTFDSTGRLLATVFSPGSSRSLILAYRRNGNGQLISVTRTRGRNTSSADPDRRDTSVMSDDLDPLRDAQIEQWEARLLLGSPATQSDNRRGSSRRLHDSFSQGCWLNATSSLEYDAAGLIVSTVQDCICGFCVDASLPVYATSVQGVDLHWTRGPWLRLDGVIDVTEDHEVETLDGPRPAGSLHAGALVLTSDGSLHSLTSVVRLPDTGERLGRNVRTASGLFSAGGILFRSEQTKSCAPSSHAE